MEQTGDARQRVERVLTEGLERVQSAEIANAVVEHIERLCVDSEAERAAAVARRMPNAADAPAAAAESIERSVEQPLPENAVASALEHAAEQAITPTPAAAPVVEAAHATLTPSAAVSPPAQRGRRLLRDAMLRRMGPLQALDARIYLAVNELPHPGWLDTVGWAIAVTFIGGWIWVIGTLVAYLLRVPRGWTAVMRLLPCVVGATWVVEFPVKMFFRRRRPFVRIVQALVIGKKPGSWSFPSGHTVSSFASAWALTTVWPRTSPLFFGLASVVGFSRVYVGAHYPGDVASGALCGMVLSELIRRLTAWFLP